MSNETLNEINHMHNLILQERTEAFPTFCRINFWVAMKLWVFYSFLLVWGCDAVKLRSEPQKQSTDITTDHEQHEMLLKLIASATDANEPMHVTMEMLHVSPEKVYILPAAPDIVSCLSALQGIVLNVSKPYSDDKNLRYSRNALSETL